MELRHGNGISTGNVFAVNSVGRLGKVCDPYWNDISALVVCRQLGLGGGQAVNISFFGDEAGQPAMYQAICEGHEDTLQECDYHMGGMCAYSETAGVICQ